ncbi:MAG: SpoIIE family protein phosphatase [Pontiella sp.]
MNGDILNSDFLLETLMKNTSDSIYFKDLQSRFIMVNKSCADKHGWPNPESAIGTSDFDTFAREHAELAFANEQRIIETGEPQIGIEEKETWPDGKVTWVSSSKMPLKDANGKIIGTFGITRDVTERKQAELRAKRYAAEIRRIKEGLEDEARMAGELQKNFCPSKFPIIPPGASAEDSSVEFLYSFNLNRQVTGDYCAIMQVSKTAVGIFVSDVCGTGVRAALGTALIRGVMQEISTFGHNPGSYLDRMNELLFPLLQKEELSLEVTACYIVLDVSTGIIRMANAGHPMPILFHEANSAGWLGDESDSIGPPLAVESTTAFATMERKIVAGDTVVLFTDGLYTVPNKTGDLYGKKRLIDSAHSLACETLKDIFQGLEGDALSFSKDGKFSDDVCLVGVNLRMLLDEQ